MNEQNNIDWTKEIEWFEKQLEKVKAMHNPDKYDDDLRKDKCYAYIASAERDLEAVKNGMNPFAA
jgi:hypothetical protein